LYASWEHIYHGDCISTHDGEGLTTWNEVHHALASGLTATQDNDRRRESTEAVNPLSSHCHHHIYLSLLLSLYGADELYMNYKVQQVRHSGKIRMIETIYLKIS
jgi:hypothetical protein